MGAQPHPRSVESMVCMGFSGLKEYTPLPSTTTQCTVQDRWSMDEI